MKISNTVLSFGFVLSLVFSAHAASATFAVGGNSGNKGNSLDDGIYLNPPSDIFAVKNCVTPVCIGTRFNDRITIPANSLILSPRKINALGGDDVVVANSGLNIVYGGGNGNDILVVKSISVVTANGGAGDDVMIFANPGTVKAYGDAGRDIFILNGTRRADIAGGSGLDTVMNYYPNDNNVYKGVECSLTNTKSQLTNLRAGPCPTVDDLLKQRPL